MTIPRAVRRPSTGGGGGTASAGLRTRTFVLIPVLLLPRLWKRGGSRMASAPRVVCSQPSYMYTMASVCSPGDFGDRGSRALLIDRPDRTCTCAPLTHCPPAYRADSCWRRCVCRCGSTGLVKSMGSWLVSNLVWRDGLEYAVRVLYVLRALEDVHCPFDLSILADGLLPLHVHRGLSYSSPSLLAGLTGEGVLERPGRARAHLADEVLAAAGRWLPGRCGKSSALPWLMILGLKPCWTAWLTEVGEDRRVMPVPQRSRSPPS